MPFWQGRLWRPGNTPLEAAAERCQQVGGSVGVVHANANGFVHLGPTTSISGDFTPTAAELHTLQPRLLLCRCGELEVEASAPAWAQFPFLPRSWRVYHHWLRKMAVEAYRERSMMKTLKPSL